MGICWRKQDDLQTQRSNEDRLASEERRKHGSCGVLESKHYQSIIWRYQKDNIPVITTLHTVSKLRDSDEPYLTSVSLLWSLKGQHVNWSHSIDPEQCREWTLSQKWALGASKHGRKVKGIWEPEELRERQFISWEPSRSFPAIPSTASQNSWYLLIFNVLYKYSSHKVIKGLLTVPHYTNFNEKVLENKCEWKNQHLKTPAQDRNRWRRWFVESIFRQTFCYSEREWKGPFPSQFMVD